MQNIARKQQYQPSATHCLYTVDLKARHSDLLKVSDWGTPGPIGLAMTLRDELPSKHRNRLESFRQELVRMKVAKLNFEVFGWNWIRAFLSSQQKRGLKYKNIVEGDEGVISWCIVDPADVRIIGKRTISQTEIAFAEGNLRIKWHRTDA